VLADADYNMNDPENILAVIYRARDWINGELPADRQLTKAPQTRLPGSQSVLDSLPLVSLLITIEQEVADTIGVPVTLARLCASVCFVGRSCRLRLFPTGSLQRRIRSLKISMAPLN
jgi:hypothetical protein